MSDSDSRDSDEGIRYKTESVRKKRSNNDSEGDNSLKECKLYEPNKKIKKDRKKADHNICDLSKTNRNINNKDTNVPLISTKVDDENDKSSFGPSLPPNFKTNLNKDIEEIVIGPALPPHLLKTDDKCSSGPKITEPANSFVGPQLPSHLLQINDQRNQEKSIGPILPQSENLNNTQNTNITLAVPTCPSQESENAPNNCVGPTFPPHLQKNKEEFESQMILDPKLPSSIEAHKSQNKIIGPALPSHFFQKTHSSSDEDDDESYGPLPRGLEKYSKTQQALEERALQLKIDQLDPKCNTEPVRETWMLELPEAKAMHFGLGPRQFRSKAGPDLSDRYICIQKKTKQCFMSINNYFRSSWTDIPNTKEKTKKPSVNLQQEAVNKEMKKRDKEQDLLVKKHKKRDKSLIEMHQEKLNQQKKVRYALRQINTIFL